MSDTLAMKTDLKIALTLSQLLKQRGLTLKDVSKATAVLVSSLSEWKSNNRNPNATHAKAVADFLGVTVHYLLFGYEDQQEPLQKILKEE